MFARERSTRGHMKLPAIAQRGEGGAGGGSGELALLSEANPRRSVMPGQQRQRIRLNHSSDKPADSSASTDATSASKPEISVSFFSTVRRELKVL